MEEQVIQFVEEISESRIMTSNEMLDMRITLLEEMNRSVSPQNSSMFLKSLREKMDASDNSIFTENGLNVEAVKSLATTVAKDVEKKVNTRIEVEQSVEKNNNNRINEVFNEVDNDKDNDKDDNNKLDFSDILGYDFEATEDEINNAQKVLGAFSCNSTREDAAKFIDTADIYQEINNLIRNEGMTYEEALTITLAKRNIDRESERANEILNVGKKQVFALIIGTEIDEMYNQLLLSNPDAMLTDINIDELMEKIESNYPEFSDFFQKGLRELIENNIRNKSSQNKSKNDSEKQDDNSKQEFEENQNQSKAPRGRFKVTERVLDMAKGLVEGLSELDKNIKRSMYDSKVTDAKDYKDDYNRHKDMLKNKGLEIKSRDYVALRHQTENVRNTYIKTSRAATIEGIEKYDLDAEEFQRITKNREIIIENLIERFFEEDDKHLADFYSEIDIEVLDENQIIFSDLSQALKKRMTDNPLYTNLSNTLIISETMINSKIREINALKDLRDAMNSEIKSGKIYSHAIPELAKIDEKIRNLESVINEEKKQSKINKDIFRRDAAYKVKHQEYKEKQATDYIGVAEELTKSKLTEDEYVDLKNSFIKDRNKIKALSVKQGISEFEAAKKYFFKEFSALNKYAEPFKNFFDGQNTGENFSLDIMDDIINFHNNRTKIVLTESLTKALYKYEDIVEHAVHPESLIEIKTKITESKAQYIKAINLEDYLSKDKAQRSNERGQHLNEAVNQYFSSNKSVTEIVSELSELGIKDIDTNEVLKLVVKKVEEQNPGTGKKLIELEMQMEKLEISKEVHMDLLDKSKHAHIYKKAWNAEIDNVNRSMEIKRKEIDGIKGKYLEQNAKNTDTKEEQEEYGAIEEGNRFRKMSPIDVSKVISSKGTTSQELYEQIGIIIEVGKDEQEVIKENQEDRAF